MPILAVNESWTQGCSNSDVSILNVVIVSVVPTADKLGNATNPGHPHLSTVLVGFSCVISQEHSSKQYSQSQSH